MTEILTDGPVTRPVHLILAHGAGAGMSGPAMTALAAALAAQPALCIHRFEFDYMAARSRGGSRRPPPRAETLCGEYDSVAGEIAAKLGPSQRLFIGGKSMGGRVASLIADALWSQRKISGLVCFGYPFHPIGKPEKLRTAHLEALRCPTLIVQGTRDPFGTRDEVAGYALSAAITMHWLENGNHDLKGAGRGVMQTVARAVAAFTAAAETSASHP